MKSDWKGWRVWWLFSSVSFSIIVMNSKCQLLLYWISSCLQEKLSFCGQGPYEHNHPFKYSFDDLCELSQISSENYTILRSKEIKHCSYAITWVGRQDFTKKPFARQKSHQWVGAFMQNIQGGVKIWVPRVYAGKYPESIYWRPVEVLALIPIRGLLLPYKLGQPGHLHSFQNMNTINNTRSWGYHSKSKLYTVLDFTK